MYACQSAVQPAETFPISTAPTPFTTAERTRFRNLLELANASPYAGERANALAAAERLAARHGMSLEDAAADRGQEPPRKPSDGAPHITPEAELARAVHLMDREIQADKARIARAFEDAVARGLDSDERARRRPIRSWQPFRSRRRRNPRGHARVLLEETSLPIDEIASITGLDIHTVAGLKLKLRRGVACPQFG